MKKLAAITVMIFLFSGSLAAQRVLEKTFKPEQDAKILMKFDFADSIRIETWKKNEVYVKVIVSINDNKDNEAFQLEFDDHGWYVEIESKINELDKLAKKNQRIVRQDGQRITTRGHSVDLDLAFWVYLPEGQTLEAETISGDILMEGYPGEMKLKTISGFIDLSLPETYGADVKMSTISGGMYSNFDFDANGPDGLRSFGKRSMTSSLNSGGTSLKLETISGDIFLRKR